MAISVQDYEIEECPDELFNLTSELLFEIFTLTINLGMPYEDGNFMIRFDALSIVASPKTGGMILERKPKENRGSFVVEAKCWGIIWDTAISVVFMRRALTELRHTAQDRGLINLKGNFVARLKVVQPIRFNVNDCFSQLGAAMPIFPGVNAEQRLAQFDHPELLMIYKGPLGTQTIIRRNDLKRIKQRESKAMQALLKRGIRLESMADLDSLSFEKIMAIREEIDKAMSEE